ncbi:hypothetical protein GTP44_16900 [Duganella sp. FT50W]|uniref:HEPN domain-containing protein n=1 Tax=Duganella lactea TaxID=2692173 RepID=A0A6L8MKB0_9BURK|nr:hypothetical protein [Duganella lactea]MYM83627.1 hypothetical protein [Duganella lactea]
MPNSAEFHFFPNESILEQAKEFSEASKVLRDRRSLVVPFIVNGLFSLELFLKCLHAKTVYSNAWDVGNYDKSLLRSKDHSLRGLFEELPDSKQDWLNLLHAEFFEGSPRAPLVEDLGKFDRAFVDWRYRFEGKAVSVPTSILNELINFFEFACSKPSTERFKFGA